MPITKDQAWAIDEKLVDGKISIDDLRDAFGLEILAKNTRKLAQGMIEAVRDREMAGDSMMQLQDIDVSAVVAVLTEKDGLHTAAEQISNMSKKASEILEDPLVSLSGMEVIQLLIEEKLIAKIPFEDHKISGPVEVHLDVLEARKHDRTLHAHNDNLNTGWLQNALDGRNGRNGRNDDIKRGIR